MLTDFPKRSFKNTSEDLRKIPRTSGLYYFYDKDNNVLYIGKAKILRSRIREHSACNDRAREGKFYQNLRKANLSPESRQKLEEVIREFEFRCMATTYAVAIDFVFHRTTRIDIEEVPHELTEDREADMISELKPLFNSETACDEYYEITS